MADNQKYYYLKLKDNFFDSEQMVWLENQKDGYKYSSILLKLCLKSLKTDGKLMVNDRIPYSVETLSKITRNKKADVEKALKLFIELGLVEVLDNGAIFMTDIQSLIGNSNSEADRKRAYRERIANEKQLIEAGQSSGQMSAERPPEIKAYNLEIKDKSIETTDDDSLFSTYSNSLDGVEQFEQEQEEVSHRQQSLSSISTFWQTNGFGQMPPVTMENFDYWMNDFQELGSCEEEAAELIIRAMSIAVDRGSRNYSYINGILKKWLQKALKNVEAVEAYEKGRNKNNSSTPDSELPETGLPW